MVSIKDKIKNAKKVEKTKLRYEKDTRKRTVFITYSILCLTLMASFMSLFVSMSNNATETTQQKQEVKQDVINVASIKNYTDPFINEYMNVSQDREKQDGRLELLQAFLADNVDSNAFDTSATGDQTLNSKALVSATKNKAGNYNVVYRVNFTSAGKTQQNGKEIPVTKKQDADLHIELAEKDGKYAVASLPYLTAVASSQASIKGENRTIELDAYDKSDEKEMEAFVTEFFQKYASSKTEDMAYMMAEPESLNGLLSYSKIVECDLYKQKSDCLAAVEVEFVDPTTNITTTENFELTITDSNNHYFVEKLEHK
ncbi:conjugal transfer protein [Listeria costaricensis]|uniref:conjugal transfer protein n=1 Tax=Listeria costaricensis TaxID=2026604 RepID=UPI000C07EA86|nr:conjugal transfer protein [Listeria costaricensis]